VNETRYVSMIGVGIQWKTHTTKRIVFVLGVRHKNPLATPHSYISIII